MEGMALLQSLQRKVIPQALRGLPTTWAACPWSNMIHTPKIRLLGEVETISVQRPLALPNVPPAPNFLAQQESDHPSRHNPRYIPQGVSLFDQASIPCAETVPGRMALTKDRPDEWSCRRSRHPLMLTDSGLVMILGM